MDFGKYKHSQFTPEPICVLFDSVSFGWVWVEIRHICPSCVLCIIPLMLILHDLPWIQRNSLESKQGHILFHLLYIVRCHQEHHPNHNHYRNCHIKRIQWPCHLRTLLNMDYFAHLQYRLFDTPMHDQLPSRQDQMITPPILSLSTTIYN